MVSIPPDSHRLTRLGPWVIQRVLGEGGMGIVYDAHDPTTGQRVALKALHGALSRNDVARSRFEAEMRILDGLVHPNIVRSLGSGVLDGRVVIVLEYLEGQTLRELIRSVGPLPPVRAAAIGEQIALALVSAHLRAKPIVHRDLKPENIMVLPTGAVKVMDFGVAKVLREIDAMTMGTKQVGTVRYMAPEQSDGRGISGKTDCYGLGLLLYEMLVGRPPFDGTTLVGILRQHCEAPPPPFDAALKARTPRELEELVFALLSKRAEDRPDAATANAALRRIASAPQPAGSTALAASGGPAPLDAIPAASPAACPDPPIVVTPIRAPGRAPPGSPPAPLDTIGLIEHNTSKGRPRWPWIVGGIALPVIAAAIVLPIVLSSGPSTPRSARSSDPSGTPTLDAVIASTRCPTLRCAPLGVADASSIDEPVLVDKAVALAREVDPSAEIASVVWMGAVNEGRIDLTRRASLASVLFTARGGNLAVSAQPTGLMVSWAAGIAPPALLPACPLARAFETARAANFPILASTNAIRAASPRNKAGSDWVFVTGAATLYVDVDCRVDARE